MAEKRVIDLEVNVDGNVEKEFEDLNDAVKDVKKSLKGTQDEIKKVEKGTKGLKGATAAAATGFKAIGTALKASGIGLVIGAFVAFKEVLTQNETVANGLSVAFEAVSIVFNQVVGVIVDAVKSVSAATNGFEGLKKVVSGLITIALTPLKATFHTIILAIKGAQLAWEKSMFGNNDPKTIKTLRQSIADTKKDLENVGTSALAAGKQVGQNFTKAIGEVASLAGKVSEGVQKVSITAAVEQAKVNVQVKNAAILAAAEQARLIEKYDLQAEKLRQIRDEERNTIDERKKANDDLAKVLDKQEKAMLRQADLQIQAAINERNKSNTIENQVAVLEAQANREGVLAQIAGFRSEQLANDLALDREKIELTNSKLEAETNLSIEQKKFVAEQITDETARIEALKKVNEEERILALNTLQTKVDSYKEGTQLRLDAEIEYNAKKQELDQTAASLELSLLNAQKVAKDKIAEDEIKTEQEVAEAKAAIQQANIANVDAGINLLKTIFEKNKGIQKALLVAESASSIAKIILNTKAANAAATLKYALLPGGIALAAAEKTANNISAGLGIGASIAATAKALSAMGGGSAPQGNIGNDAGGGGATAQAPAFNVVGSSGINQLAQLNAQPFQAFVVSSEVTTAQSLDRNRIQNATF
jgi:hypothetical protein